MACDAKRFGTLRMATLLPLVAVAVILTVDTVPDLAAEGGYVGPEICAECHEDVSAGFISTAHGRGSEDGGMGTRNCEACHGPGQAHVDAGGEGGIYVGASADVTKNCLSCHSADRSQHWRASSHDEFDMQCADCHGVHKPWVSQKHLRNEDVTDNCLSCHQDKRKHLYQRSSHPLRDGLMSCVDCHDPHGAAADASIAAMTPNDKCYECHAEKRGPFLYEHQPVREDCLTCHDAHGSNQTMMLQTSPPRLCQSCHLFGHHQTVPGEPTQVWNQNRSCVNCHYRIHGSNHPSGVVFLR
jgi:DmsE family decaheme c-type cytochrome